VAPPVFKTGLLSQPAKIANKTLGSLRPRRRSNWPIKVNSGHKNVYSALRFAGRFVISLGVTEIRSKIPRPSI
jgi:hypothetical protein